MFISNFRHPIRWWRHGASPHTNHVWLGRLASLLCFLELLLSLAEFSKVKSSYFFSVLYLFLVTKVVNRTKIYVLKVNKLTLHGILLLPNCIPTESRMISYVLIFPWSFSTSSVILSMFLRFSSVVNCNSLMCRSAFKAPLWVSVERAWVKPTQIMI